MYDYSYALNAQKALIWRIVHRDNIPWVLDNGLHCGNSTAQAANWLQQRSLTMPVFARTGWYF